MYELHRHLDVSVRLGTLLELAQERGLEGQSTSLEAFRRKIVLTQPLSSLDAVLGTFTLFQQVLDRPDVLERVAFEVVEDCYLDGIRGAELRFSPSFVCQLSKLPWRDCLDGFEAGVQRALKKYPDMKAGLICIASRDMGVDSVAETVDFYLKEQERFIGLDLAGPEDEWPCRMFKEPFARAQARGARITIHAGESGGPENIWDAIEILGAQRIGHGIASVRDRALMDRLKRDQICLEMCPTSNWLTRAVEDISHHPIFEVLRYGIPVTVNTDDPAVFGCTLTSELELLKKKGGLSPSEIELISKYSKQMSFLA